jgi:hypothetical protein
LGWAGGSHIATWEAEIIRRIMVQGQFKASSLLDHIFKIITRAK